MENASIPPAFSNPRRASSWLRSNLFEGEQHIAGLWRRIRFAQIADKIAERLCIMP